MSDAVIEALGVCFEVLGQEARPAVLAVLVSDLEPYGEQRVLAGLDLLRREGAGKVTLPAIIEKIQQADGRPGVGEAWAIAISAADERNTVVWTPEISQAWAAACPLYGVDKFGARKAFEEVYQRVTREAIGQHRQVEWRASIGWDVSVRDAALTEAVTKGQLSHESVARYLPAPEASGVGAAVAGMLTGKRVDLKSYNEHQRARLAEARAAIDGALKKRVEAVAKQRAEFEAHKRAEIERAEKHPLTARCE